MPRYGKKRRRRFRKRSYRKRRKGNKKSRYMATVLKSVLAGTAVPRVVYGHGFTHARPAVINQGKMYFMCRERGGGTDSAQTLTLVHGSKNRYDVAFRAAFETATVAADARQVFWAYSSTRTTVINPLNMVMNVKFYEFIAKKKANYEGPLYWHQQIAQENNTHPADAVGRHTDVGDYVTYAEPDDSLDINYGFMECPEFYTPEKWHPYFYQKYKIIKKSKMYTLSPGQQVSFKQESRYGLIHADKFDNIGDTPQRFVVVMFRPQWGTTETRSTITCADENPLLVTRTKDIFRRFPDPVYPKVFYLNDEAGGANLPAYAAPGAGVVRNPGAPATAPANDDV